MADTAAVMRVVDVYSARNREVRLRVLDFIRRQWGGLESWRPADIERFVRAVVPVVQGGQIQVAALTDSYLAAVETVITGRMVRPVGVPAGEVSDMAMRGVDAAEVYARSGPTVWTALSQGSTLTAAVAKGLDRMMAVAATDMQLAHTHASRHVMRVKPGVVGYRRVLTGSASCRLCVTASTQRYRKGDLLPVHARCDCRTIPILGTEDPGRVINTELLDELKRSGNAGDLSITQARTRARGDVTAAETRIAELRDQIADADPGQRSRFEQELRATEARKAKAERMVQRRQDQLDDYRGRNGQPKTVIVHGHDELGPVLGDAAHHHRGPADVN